MMDRRHLSIRVALVLACAVALSVAPAVAQDAGATEAVDDLSREEVEVRAGAFLDVSAIQNELQARLEQASTPEEAQALQQQANQEILGALDDHELSVDEYTVAMNATQDNVEFRERFIAAVNRLQEEQSEDTEGR